MSIGDIVIVDDKYECIIIDMTVEGDEGWYECMPNWENAVKFSRWIPFNKLRLKEK